MNKLFGLWLVALAPFIAMKLAILAKPYFPDGGPFVEFICIAQSCCLMAMGIGLFIQEKN